MPSSLICRRTLALCGLLGLTACDNVGRAFDRGGSGRVSNTPTNIETVTEGAFPFNGRPKVKAVYPSGDGWAPTAPVVLVFNESINESLAVPERGDAQIFCRIKGTTTNLITTYHFVFGGSAVIMRPTPRWPASQTGGTPVEIEVLVSPELRDTDGIRLSAATEPIVAGSFIPDADVATELDGRIVATLPEDQSRDQQRETFFYMVFDRPPTANTIDADSFRFTDAANAVIPGSISFPIQDGQIDDPRVVAFDATARLAGDAEVRVTVDDTIVFPGTGTETGTLDFGGRRPYARFRTLEFATPDAVALANPQPGLANKINRANLATAELEVTLPADSRAGDEVVARVYALDPRTEPTDDVNFVEAVAAVPTDGATSVVVPLGGALGDVDRPRFSDGAATFAARVRRGARTTGWMISAANADPVVDIGVPTLTTIGPPNGGTGSFDLITDQEFLVFHGAASERLSSVALTARGSTVANFGTTTDRRFMTAPIGLSRLTAPVPYTLTLRDAAGNESQPIAGNIVQRGSLTGVLADSLTVEAYDEATLQPIANALVLLEPGMPQKPAVGRVSLTTGVDGRATFAGLTAPSYTVTILASGYDLVSLLDARVAFASLPLRPLERATANLQGVAVPLDPTGAMRVGCNVFDDETVEAIVPSANFAIASTRIRPNRLLALSGYLGLLNSVGNGTFLLSGHSMCGTTGTQAVPAFAAVSPGQATTQQLAVATSAAGTVVATSSYTRDFATAAGLGTVVDGPTVRVVSSLLGVSGTTLFGIGAATAAGSQTAFAVASTYSRLNVLALAPLSPVVWVSLEGRDAAGNLARHRAIVADLTSGSTLGTWPVPGVPTIAAPSGPFVGSPVLSYEDRLDVTVIPGGLAMVEITATDSGSRRWVLRREDRNGAVGATAVQFPDLDGTGVQGLLTGTWRVRAVEHLAFSITAVPGDFMLEELRRAQVTYARTAPVDFTVN